MKNASRLKRSRARLHQIRNPGAVLLSLVLWGAVSLISCVTTGPGGKKSFLLIGSGEESAIGADMNKQIREESSLLDDSLWQDYINEVGQRIVAVCDRKDIEYHFAVIDSDQINAFALPGGYLYF
ncbi:MAG: hypothetical protein ACE5GA_10800 [Candidatus Zixiibacteriota bacterium]